MLNKKIATCHNTPLRRTIMVIMIVLAAFSICNPSISTADTEPLNIIKPASGVYVHLGRQEAMSVDNRAEIANIGFIVGESSVMVIDPGGNPAQGKRLLKAIRDVTDLPISYVVLTHFHPDHVFGAKAFVQSGLFVAHQRYPLAMIQRAGFYRKRFSHLNVDGEGDLVVPDLLVSDTMSVELGNRPITIVAYSTAHTDHDVAVFDSLTGTLWASDLLFVERIPSLDGSVVGWLDTIKSLQARSDLQLIIPGHGKPGKPNEVLDPMEKYLSKLIDETRDAVGQNVGLLNATKTVAQDEQDNWLLFDLQHQGNVTKAYTELEWE